MYVLVTMRADFYPNAMESALWPRMAASRVEIVPPHGDELREAIREPALARRVVVDEALVERLAAETEGQPGLLPFLQEALVALWDRLHWRLLSLSAYEEMRGDDPTESGVLQAIRRQADATVRALEAESPGSERVVRSIFLRLVQFGEGREHTRRRQSVAELRTAAPDETTFERIFARLADRRLLTPDKGPDGEPVADLAHEAIIQGWPTLRRWIDEGSAAEQTRRRLVERAQEWEQRVAEGHPRVGLLDDVEMAEAQRSLAETDAGGAAVDPRVERYVAASRARSAQSRRRWRTAIVAGFVALALVVAVLSIATIRARRAERSAEREAVQRTALQLNAAAAALPTDRVSLRALLVRSADEIDPSRLSQLEMLATAERSPAVIEREDSVVRNVGFDALWADNDRLVVGDSDGKLHVWQADDGRVTSSEKPLQASQPLFAIAREPGTDRYAVGGGDVTAEGGELVDRDGAVDLVDLGAQERRSRRSSCRGRAS